MVAFRATSGPALADDSLAELEVIAPREIQLPADPAGFAEGLYDALRRADGSDASLILVVVPGSGPSWRAVRDRLERAAATSS